MKKLVAIVLALSFTGIALAQDKVISITVPDTFTEADISYVKELANVAKERVILKPITPPQEAIITAQTKIDEYRVKDNLQAKFTKAEEVKVEEVKVEEK